jgi:hypothetical protein
MSTNLSIIKKEEIIEKYIQTLNEKEHKAYLIAKNHLGDSFQIEKSNGFLKWLENNNKTESNMV